MGKMYGMTLLQALLQHGMEALHNYVALARHCMPGREVLHVAGLHEVSSTPHREDGVELEQGMFLGQREVSLVKLRQGRAQWSGSMSTGLTRKVLTQITLQKMREHREAQKKWRGAEKITRNHQILMHFSVHSTLPCSIAPFGLF